MRGVSRNHPEFKLRRQVAPVPEPVEPENAAAAWGWSLLELTSAAIASERTFQLLHLRLPEALREHQFSRLGARVSPADAGRAPVRRVKAHWDAQMHIGQIHLQDDAGYIFFVQALHDDDNRAFLGVDPGWQSFGECNASGLKFCRAVGAVCAYWVVEDDSVTTNPGHRGEAARLSNALLGVAKFALAVQVCQQVNGPQLLIPLRFN